MAATEADLVLEGGGVKGAGLLGAVTGLDAAGYTFRRCAGTSAGAIVASYLAAGVPIDELKTIMFAQDFGAFEDNAAIFKQFKLIGEGLGLLLHEGMFRGDVLHTWIEKTLADQGVHTWGDLRLAGDDVDPIERYKLVVVVSDVSHGRELRLPWDYDRLGVDADEQPVADAVRASASIPFFFRPTRLRAAHDRSDKRGYVLGTDGGMLSNYPIDIFDTGARSRPTLGVKLSARTQLNHESWAPNENALDLAKSLLSTMMDAHDALHVDDPYYADRTTFVDASGYSATDFDLTQADKTELFTRGLAAAQKFLSTWDWTAFQATHGARVARPANVVAQRDLED